MPALLDSYLETGERRLLFSNFPGEKPRRRPQCDAIELASVAGCAIPGEGNGSEVVALVKSCQDASLGIVPEMGSPPAPDEELPDLYLTMAANYALECLGSHLPAPVKAASRITTGRLPAILEGLDWKENAWGAGHWIDCYASCLCINERYFGEGRAMLPVLFGWLDAKCNPRTGLWGMPTASQGWLQPVNGFYRLTRGTYAQFGRPLPYPEKAIDTILEHTGNPVFAGRGNACNVLDVTHPLWLCLKQTAHRREDAEKWVRSRIQEVLNSWVKNKGFAFDLDAESPGLQGTEMWLSIVYLMADICGLSPALGYTPNGIHRPEPAIKL